MSGIIRADADGNGAQELERLGGLPSTAEFTTVSGGHGWLMKYETWITTDTFWTGNGEHNELRVQSTGAIRCSPPSSGYQWMNKRGGD